MKRDSMEFDIVCAGCGVSTLSTILTLLRRVKKSGGSDRPKPTVLIIEKAENIGNHALSGAVVDPEAFEQLLTPDELKKLPVETNVSSESFYSLTENGGFKLPWIPPMMHANGFPMLSLSALTRYLAKLCEAEGAEIYTGFSAAMLLEENGRISGIRIGDKGLDKDGSQKHSFEPGPDILSKIVILGEGAHGKLTEKLIADRHLTEGQNAQAFALGIKEIIETPDRPELKGSIVHTFAYPLDSATYGGGYVYHMSDTKVCIGMAIGLDYHNPTINPHDLFRLFKLNPVIQPHIAGGKVTGYGAKVLAEGGYNSTPQLVTDGAMIVGEGAGLLDSLRLKGIHIAIQSGIAAGETLFECWQKDDYSLAALKSYQEKFRQMSGWKQLERVRNVRAAFTYGSFPGIIAAGMSWATFGILPPGKFRIEEDWKGMKPKADCNPWKAVPKPDDATTNIQLDRLTDVFFSGTKHEEHQPCHLKIIDTAKCKECIGKFGAPCTLFCPAQVYTLADDNQTIRIDPSNCLHCKTCQIKDPYRNIEWNLPEGGGGPHYKDM